MAGRYDNAMPFGMHRANLTPTTGTGLKCACQLIVITLTLEPALAGIHAPFSSIDPSAEAASFFPFVADRFP
jgi:hypothetical protein